MEWHLLTFLFFWLCFLMTHIKIDNVAIKEVLQRRVNDFRHNPFEDGRGVCSVETLELCVIVRFQIFLPKTQFLEGIFIHNVDETSLIN